MSEDHLRHYVVALLFASLMPLAGCGTTLRPVDARKTLKLLPPQHILSVRDACSGSLKYADQTRRIFVYRLDFDDERAVCNPHGPYELVVILDRDDQVERYRLLRAK